MPIIVKRMEQFGYDITTNVPSQVPAKEEAKTSSERASKISGRNSKIDEAAK